MKLKKKKKNKKKMTARERREEDRTACKKIHSLRRPKKQRMLPVPLLACDPVLPSM
jgi:hypothetical protein